MFEVGFTKKAFPLLFRKNKGNLELLAFRHPLAGNQFVKGTIEMDESPEEAARRELREESGVVIEHFLEYLGETAMPQYKQYWYFFITETADLSSKWEHQTEDDFGHKFSFFWHPLSSELNGSWHNLFHDAFQFLEARVRLFQARLKD